jgi:hypothetical protein
VPGSQQKTFVGRLPARYLLRAWHHQEKPPMPRLLLGLALGAASAFLLDPQQGRRRRALLRDKVTTTVNQGRVFTDAATRDLRYRAQGIAAQARSWRGGGAPDDILIERVRAKLGRYCSHPGAVEVSAHNRRVVLTGDVLASERESIYDAVCAVPGVEHVENNLTAHESAQGVSSLQDSWSPGVRLLAGGAGALLLLYALSRGGLGSIGALAAGAALVSRASANRPLAGMLPQRATQAA